MNRIMNIHSIEETILWNRLDSGFKDNNEKVAQNLANNLITICDDAITRMKTVPVLHTQYTLHDEVHLLRVTQIMAMILSDEGLEKLNPIEIALLILAAFFHDQGMVLNDDEIEKMNNDNDFNVFKQNWILNHPNFSDIHRRISDINLSEMEKDRSIKAYAELQNALLSDYIRINHGEAAKNYVEDNYKDDSLWKVSGISLAHYAGKLCKSHNEDIKNINDMNGFRVDENIATYKVNMQFLAIVLRLADILDFDRDRTPDSIYKTIHFSNNVSLIEWEKHKSVYGWEINKDSIQFTMKCEHPIYQRAAFQFMDWIDEELINSHNVISKFPANVQQYRLHS